MSNREIDLSKPSLPGLSYLLRNDAIWPIGFVWDFSVRDTCAIGLASEYWGIPIERDGLAFTTQTFNMTKPAALDLFYGKGDWAPKGPTNAFTKLILGELVACREITPLMVADAIDDYVLRHAIDHPQLVAA